MTGLGDLSTLFASAPAQGSQDMRYRQGVIQTFNQSTLQNTVLVGGSVFTNLPILGVGESTLLVPGSVVGLLVIGENDDPNSGGKTYAIIGRLVTPNTADANNAISLLNSQIFSDFIGDPLETITSTTYQDLPRVGPAVTLPVGPTGRVLVLCSAQMQWSAGFAANIGNQARIALDITGANTIPVSDTGPLLNMLNVSLQVTAGTIAETIIAHMTAQANITGLNPGSTTFKMMYRNNNAATNTSDVTRRTLTVIKL